MNEGLAFAIGLAVGVVTFLFILALAGDFHFFQVAAGFVLGGGTYQALKRKP
jgi:hypothetical protein